MKNLEAVTLKEVRAARERISDTALRTPLMRMDDGNSSAEIYLKLENLQPMGSFKVRGVTNVLKKMSKERLSRGIATASSGNLGLAMARLAQRMGIPCTVILQDTSPEAKLTPLREAGGKIIKFPFDEWFEIVSTGKCDGLEGHFIHPVFDPDMMAGHGTMGLEILEELPDVDAVIMPCGGGGLCCGVSAAIHALKPDTKIFVSEVDTAAPVTAALEAGEPKEIIRKPASFHCVGAARVLNPVWPLLNKFLSGSIVVSLEEVADAIRKLARNQHVVAEGSGALPVAAALTGRAGAKKAACVVTGGNIDLDIFAKILLREIPQKK